MQPQEGELAIEFRRGGRKVSSKDFFAGIMDDAIERALDGYVEDLHAKAASIVDPETGKHAAVFARRIGKDQVRIETTGSTAFARELERRMGLEVGQVNRLQSERAPVVYLAHATEDKSLARPLAEGLIVRGIEVWYDQWEIGLGDSVRRKMDEGLGNCTHFVVLLTETSLAKPWVNEEIDAGLLAAVEGTARFVGLRHELAFSDLPPLLRSRLSPELEPGDVGLDALAAQIYGVSDKPPLGPAPRFVRSEKGSSWSGAALALAEYFVRHSVAGDSMDPQANYEQLREATGLPKADVRLGVLDLVQAGMLERSNELGSDWVWPHRDLFSTFDAMFTDHDPQKDAQALATHLFNRDDEVVNSEEVAQELGWEARRFNPAAHWLVSARIVRPVDAFGGPYTPYRIICGDELLRFVRSL